MKRLKCERLEARDNPAPLPVLLVIADQQDFFYQEYNDTRNSLLADNVPVVVAATTTAPSKAHAGSGQGTGSGIVTPNIALANAKASDYSAIAFVGGWGASMYQYAFNDPNVDGKTDNFYFNSAYNGDANLNDGIIAPQKVIVNDLINEFLAHDKPVAGVCHGVTVLAWARVNGVSPISGKNVVVPHTDGTPGMMYNGTSYAGGFAQGQYIQAQANGAIVSATGGGLGNPTTSADDVVVDGRIITAENQHSAAYFGHVIAQQVNEPPTPIVGPTSITIPEGVPGTIASYSSTDPEGGPISWSLAGPNATKFSISSTGVLSSTVEFDGPTNLSVVVVATDKAGKDHKTEIEVISFNTAPSVGGLSGPTTLIVGETGTFTLTAVSDVAADLPGMRHSFWKLGGSPVGGYEQASPFLFTALTHNEAGTYTIFGRAYDKDGGISATKSFTYTVVAPPTVLSFNVNDGAAQRSRVTSLTVTFTAQVNAGTVGAIAITRDDGVAVLPTEELFGNYHFNTNGTTTATFTFSPTANSAAVRNGSLTEGRWRLAIPSIGYTSPVFHRLFGDIDGNGSVEGATDFAAFGNDFGRTMTSPFDVNGDGVVDGATDFAAFGANFGRTL